MNDIQNFNEAQASAPDTLPVTKAGVLFFERGHELSKKNLKYPYLKMVIGKSDRYGSGSYECLPKGGVDTDKGESPLVGAVRETGEETGIWLSQLLGTDNYARLLAGEEIRNIDSPGYQGVRVVKASPEPVSDHVYASRYGRKSRLQLFAVEIQGIDALQPHLKKADKQSGDTLPSFKEALKIMRSGVVKAGDKPWQGPQDTVLFAEPVLPKLEKEYGSTGNLRSWLLLCESIPGRQHKQLKQQMELLKGHLSDKKLIDDALPLPKFDISDRPLTVYSEWGEIARASDVLRNASRQATHSDVYRGSMWGGAPLARQRARGIKAAEQSQIGGLVKFLEREAPMEIVDASIMNPPTCLDPRMLHQIDANLPTSRNWAERMAGEPPTDRNR